MSERNVFCVDRAIWTHPEFDDEVFTQREAWMWIVGEAAWKERRVRGQNGSILLTRGQLSHSIRFMAEAWGWHRSRVERFIDRLVTRDMLERQVETGQLVLTICNYERFQLGGDVDRDTVETSPETRSRRPRDTVETNKNQETKKPLPLPAVEDAAAPLAAEDDDDPDTIFNSGLRQAQPVALPAKPDVPGDALLRVYAALGGKLPTAKPKKAAAATPSSEESDFDAFWLAYPARPNNPRKPALEKYLRARRNGASHEAIMAGVRALAAEWRKRPKSDLGYCPQATTWLNQERWADVAPVQQQDSPAVSDAKMDEMWRGMVAGYRERKGSWSIGFGPEPGQAGCRCPARILAEFGYSAAA